MGVWAIFKKFERARPFTEQEAWTLFRVAALAEAGGWTLLIIGIGLKQYVLHGNDMPVLIAGQFHGMIFLSYLVAALGLYPSLKWPRWQAIVAAIASVPPYGSLVFELWAAHRRHQTAIETYRYSLGYTLASAAIDPNE